MQVCIREEVGRSPLRAFSGLQHPYSRCPSRMVTPLLSEQAEVRVLGPVDVAQVAISSQVSLQSIWKPCLTP